MKRENREYEILFIVKANLGDAQYQEIITKFSELIAKNEGEIINLKPWGLRNICTTFKKHTQGFYVECQFSGSNKTLDAIKKAFQVNENIIRHLIVLLDSIKPKKILKEAVNA